MMMTRFTPINYKIISCFRYLTCHWGPLTRSNHLYEPTQLNNPNNSNPTGSALSNTIQMSAAGEMDQTRPSGQMPSSLSKQVLTDYLDAWCNEIAHEKHNRQHIIDHISIKDNKLYYNGTLTLNARSSVSALPMHLHVTGDLIIENNDHMASLPDGLCIDGNLLITECNYLRYLPEELYIEKNLTIINCHNLISFPQVIRIGQDMRIEGSRDLYLPEGLHVGRHIQLMKLGNVLLPNRLIVYGNLEIEDVDQLTHTDILTTKGNCSFKEIKSMPSLPRKLTTVGTTLSIITCQSLASFSNCVIDCRYLHIYNCDALNNLIDSQISCKSLSIYYCANLTELMDELDVKGNLTVSYCDRLSRLPNNLTVLYNLRISDCHGLNSIYDSKVDGNFHVINCENLTHIYGKLDITGNMSFEGCSRLIYIDTPIDVGGCLNFTDCSNLVRLPNNLRVGESLDLTNCSQLLSTPTGLSIGQNFGLNLRGCVNLTTLADYLSNNTIGFVNLDGCIQIRSLPEWVFHLTTEVNAQNTGIPDSLIDEYNNRQRNESYRGPLLTFNERPLSARTSMNDQLIGHDLHQTGYYNANNLNSIISFITSKNDPHDMWMYAPDNDHPFNSLKLFLNRLLSELPTGSDYQYDLSKIRENLIPIFHKMESEFDINCGDISKCDFINTILFRANEATETCIDRIKVGYLFIQIHGQQLTNPEVPLEDSSLLNNDLETLNHIIKTVEDIKTGRVLFSRISDKFFYVAKAILNNDPIDNVNFNSSDETSSVHLTTLLAKYLLNLSEPTPPELKLSDDEWTFLTEQGYHNFNKNELTLVVGVMAFPLSFALDIADETEEILSLAYGILGNNFHKINMNYEFCCNIRDNRNFNYKRAAIEYINQITFG